MSTKLVTLSRALFCLESILLNRNSSHQVQSKMDKKTLKLITQRVLVYSKDPTHEGQAKEELDSHIEALAEVFGVSIEEVTEISNQVLTSEKDKKTFKERLLSHYWKYLAGGLLLIVLLVLFFLLGKVQILEKNTVPSISIAEPLSNPLRSQGLSNTTTQNNTPYVHKAIFAQILVSIMPIRIAMREHYYMQGEYPSQLKDMGLNRKDMSSGKYIRDIRLGDQRKGELIIKTTEQLGKNIYISFAPIEVMGGLNIEWQCKTNYQQAKLYACEQVDSKAFLTD